jgi:hypothetical protein
MHWIDPDFLPDVRGTVERFIVNPAGEIAGLILTYDNDRFLLVHVPPHLQRELEAAVKPGESIRVRGIRPRDADMIAAVSLTANDGTVIVDNGPGADLKHPHQRGKPSTVAFAGTVRLPLFGPKGELRGALLDDGSIIRIEPKMAARFIEWLRPRASIAARGNGLETKHGRVVTAKEIGPDLSHLMSATDLPREPKLKKEPAVSAHAHSAA